MFWFFVFAYTVGVFHRKIVSKDKEEIMQKFLPEIQKSFELEGFHGILENGTINEWWTQVVNGKTHAIKMTYESFSNSLCVMLYESSDHNMTLTNVGLCEFDSALPYTRVFEYLGRFR